MLISSAFKATSFSLALIAVFIIEGCGASNQTETYTYQCFYDYATSKMSSPEFDARLFWSPDSFMQRLDIYVSVKESRLKYERDSDSYKASYASDIRVLGKDGIPISKEVDRTVRRGAYPETNDNSYDAFLLSFDLNSGEYTVEISVADNDSRAKTLRVYRVNVPDISHEKLILSDILLLARYDSLGQSRRITPFILSNVGLLPDTVKFFAVVSSKKPSIDSIFFDMYRLQGRRDAIPSFGLLSAVGQTGSYDPCRDNMDTILVYRYSALRIMKEGYSFLFGSVPKPSPGSYLLKVIARDEMNDTAVATLRFQVHNQHFPDVSDDLVGMVSSLNYIASSFEIKKIVEVKTDSAMRSNLLNFWKEHGGYDKMTRYYQRVGQANRFFTSCVEGWKTPMGMFYIICGAPDNVDCEGIWNESWSYIQTSTQGSMTVVFRLARETDNLDDRYYGMEGVYSNVDLWSYYLNQWRTSY